MSEIIMSGDQKTAIAVFPGITYMKASHDFPNCFRGTQSPSKVSRMRTMSHITTPMLGAQRLSGRVLDSRPRGRGFESHRRHCVVVLEQDTFSLA